MQQIDFTIVNRNYHCMYFTLNNNNINKTWMITASIMKEKIVICNIKLDNFNGHISKSLKSIIYKVGYQMMIDFRHWISWIANTENKEEINGGETITYDLILRPLESIITTFSIIWFNPLNIRHWMKDRNKWNIIFDIKKTILIEYINGNTSDICIDVLNILFYSIKYWKKKHFKFIIKEHFNILLYRAYMKYYINNITQEKCHLFNIILSISQLLCYHDNNYQKKIYFENWCKPLNKLLAEKKVRKRKHWHKKKQQLKFELYNLNQKRTQNIENIYSYKYHKLCGYTECKQKQQDLNLNLKICKGCKSQYYCGKKCQKKDWKHHKLYCNKLKQIYKSSNEFNELNVKIINK